MVAVGTPMAPGWAAPVLALLVLPCFQLLSVCLGTPSHPHGRHQCCSGAGVPRRHWGRVKLLPRALLPFCKALGAVNPPFLPLNPNNVLPGSAGGTRIGAGELPGLGEQPQWLTKSRRKLS